MEERIAQELTWARTCPDEVVAALRERKKLYKGKEYYPPERQGGCVVTKEGLAVVDEAIAFVREVGSMGGVGDRPEPGLSLAGKDHVSDIGQTGAASHDSSDGTGAPDRARRYGQFRSYGECLWYGSEISDARAIVLDLIVDDGVPSRGHRKGVLNKVYDCVGVAYGQHATFGRMAAMELAAGWSGDASAISERQRRGPAKVSAEVLAKAKAQVSTQWKLGACCVCNQPMQGGKIMEVEALGGKLHAACFKCHACSTDLKGVPFKAHERKAFCNPCYYDRHGERCAACGKAISGTMAKCSLGTFHAECFACSACGKAVGKGAFSIASGAIACQACSAAPPPRLQTRRAGGPRPRRQRRPRRRRRRQRARRPRRRVWPPKRARYPRPLA